MIIPLLAAAAIVIALWPKEDDDNPGDDTKKKNKDDNPEKLTGNVKRLAGIFIAQEVKAFEKGDRWESLEQARAVGIKRGRKRAKELEAEKEAEDE